VPGRPGKPVRLHRPALAPDGTPKPSWRVSYYDGDGKPRETTAVGEAAAVAKAEALVARLSAQVRAPNCDRRMSDLLEEYMTSTARKKAWGPSYRQERAYAVRWLPQWFLALPCRGWEVAHSERVLAAVDRAGSPRGTEEYRRVGALLSGLRTAGRHYKYLPAGADPMIGVAYNVSPRQVQRRPDQRAEKFANVRPVTDAEIPCDDEVEELADVAEWLTGDWREGLRIRLLRRSGLRWGEAADLRVEQVGLDEPHIFVCRQTVEVRKRFSPTGETLLRDQPPKHGRDRWALYDEIVADDLARLVHAIRAERGPGFTGMELLLPAGRGVPWRASNYLNRVWGPAAAACGWQRVEDQPGLPPGGKKSGWLWTPHSLRHRYATWLVREVKADLYDVSEWMGHSDTAITRRMYVSTATPNVRSGTLAVAAWRDRGRRGAGGPTSAGSR
jgi:integrase